MQGPVAAFLDEARKRRAPGLAMGIARIVFGVLWYQQLLWKAPPDFGRESNSGLWYWMNVMAEYSIWPPHQAFVEHIAIPNFYLFAWLTLLQEMAIAISLILGLFTPLGALLAVIASINLTLGLWQAPAEWYWPYLMLTMLSALFLFTRAGRNLGVDQILARRLEGRAQPGDRWASLLRWLV